MNDEIIIENFWNTGVNGDTSLKRSELGLAFALKDEALSDNPETVFRHVIEVVGLNLVWYWIKDRNFYVIETENDPIEVRRLPIDPKWDGKCEFFKVGEYGPSSCMTGEIIATFEDPTRIWDELHINNVPIAKVLEDSMIVNWD